MMMRIASASSNPAGERSIEVRGELAFLTGGGLLILDVPDSGSIRQVGHDASLERTERGLAVEGNRALLGTYWTGLCLVGDCDKEVLRPMEQAFKVLFGEGNFLGGSIVGEIRLPISNATFERPQDFVDRVRRGRRDPNGQRRTDS